MSDAGDDDRGVGGPWTNDPMAFSSKINAKSPSGKITLEICLALQLHFLKIHVSIGNHDSKIVGADGID